MMGTMIPDKLGQCLYAFGCLNEMFVLELCALATLVFYLLGASSKQLYCFAVRLILA